MGWWIGDLVGLTTAFVLSAVGSGVGMYIGSRIANHYGG